MERSRWWHIAVVGIAIALTALLALSNPEPWRHIGAQASTVAFVLGWFLIGRHAWHSDRARVVFLVVTIVVSGAGAAFLPTMATLQFVAFPLVWSLASTRRAAVYANLWLAALVGLGLYLSLGASSEALVQTLAIEGISLAFSLGFGFWISTIAIQSEERQRLLDELHAAQDQLSALSRDAGIASERERLAREIHDTIAQDITGLVMLAQRTRRELDSGNTDAAARQLAVLEEGTRTALAETRALVAASAPIGLAADGIAPALRRLAERFGRETGIVVTVEVNDLPALDRDTEVVLLRCAQEGLANVRKHSGATAAALTIASDDKLTLTVRDNGSGFDPASPAGGFGLAGMRDRLALVNGTLNIASSPGAGTVLSAQLPGTATG